MLKRILCLFLALVMCLGTVPVQAFAEETEGEVMAAESEPVQTDPVETDPVETDPVETDPVETDPVETDPVETDPVETDPVETDPVETDPVETEPAETEPAETDPVETDPVETEPEETEPEETEPETTDPTEETMEGVVGGEEFPAANSGEEEASYTINTSHTILADKPYYNVGETATFTANFTGELPAQTQIRIFERVWNPETFVYDEINTGGTNSAEPVAALDVDAEGKVTYTFEKAGEYFVVLSVLVSAGLDKYAYAGIGSRYEATVTEDDLYITNFEDYKIYLQYDVVLGEETTMNPVLTNPKEKDVTFSYYLTSGYYDPETYEYVTEVLEKQENVSGPFVFTPTAEKSMYTLWTYVHNAEGEVVHRFWFTVYVCEWWIGNIQPAEADFYDNKDVVFNVDVFGDLPEDVYPYTIYDEYGTAVATGPIKDGKIIAKLETAGEYELELYYRKQVGYEPERLYYTKSFDVYESTDGSSVSLYSTHDSYNVGTKDIAVDMVVQTPRDPATLEANFTVYRNYIGDDYGYADPSFDKWSNEAYEFSQYYVPLSKTGEVLTDNLAKKTFKFNADTVCRFLLEVEVFSTAPEDYGRLVASGRKVIDVSEAGTFLFRELKRNPSASNYINAGQFVTITPVYEGTWPESVKYHAYAYTDDSLYIDEYGNDVGWPEDDRSNMEHVDSFDASDPKNNSWKLWLYRSGCYLIDVEINGEIIDGIEFYAPMANCYMVDPGYPDEFKNEVTGPYGNMLDLGQTARFWLNMASGSENHRVTCDFGIQRWVDAPWDPVTGERTDNWTPERYEEFMATEYDSSKHYITSTGSILEYRNDLPYTFDRKTMTFRFTPDQPGQWEVHMVIYVDGFPVYNSDQIFYIREHGGCVYGDVTATQPALPGAPGWKITYKGCILCQKPMVDEDTLMDAEEAEAMLKQLQEMEENILYYDAEGIAIFQAVSEAETVDVTDQTISFDFRKDTPPVLIGKVLPEGGTKQGVTWKSGDEDIAKVDPDTGEVTFVKPGTVKITASSTEAPVKSGEVTLHLYDRLSMSELRLGMEPQETYLDMYDAAAGLQVGAKAQLMVLDDDGYAVDCEDLEYTVTTGSQCVELDSTTGVVKAVRKGNVEIKVKLKDDLQNRTKSISFKTISPVITTPDILPVAGYKDAQKLDTYLSQDGFVVDENGVARELLAKSNGEPQVFYVQVNGLNPANERMGLPAGEFTWKSSNTKIAAVKEDQDGVAAITIAKNIAGTCTITATSKKDKKVVLSMTVNVTDFRPKLKKTAMTMDSHQEAAAVEVPVTFVTGNEIQEAAIYENGQSSLALTASYNDGVVTVDIIGSGTLPKGDRKTELVLTTVQGEVHKLPLTVKIRNTTPSYSIKQSKKVNQSLPAPFGELTVSGKLAVEDVILEVEGYTQEKVNDNVYRIVPEEGVEPVAVKGTCWVKLEGYRYLSKDFTVNVERKPLAITMNTNRTNDWFDLELAPGDETLDLNFGIRDYDSKKKDYIEESKEFSVTLADGMLRINSNDVLKHNSSKKLELWYRNQDGVERTCEVVVAVKNSLPGMTVKQSQKVNLSWWDPKGTLEITAKDGTAVKGAFLAPPKGKTVGYTLTGEGSTYTIDLTGTQGETKGTLEVELENYRVKYTKGLTVATEKKPVAAAMNTYLTNANVAVELLPNTKVKFGEDGKPMVQIFNGTKLSTEFAAVVGADGSTLAISPIRTEKQQFLKDGKKNIRIEITTESGEVQKLEMAVTVKNSLPKVEVKQTQKVNLSWWDPQGILEVKVPDGVQIENVIFKVAANKTPSYVLNGTDGRYTIDPVTGNTAAGTVEVTLAGYGKTYTKSLTIATEKKPVAAAMNTYLTDASVAVELLPNTKVKFGEDGKPMVQIFNGTKLSTEFAAEVSDDGSTLAISPIRTDKQQFLKDGKKNIRIELTTADGEVQKLEMAVTVKNSLPKVEVKQTQKVNLSWWDPQGILEVKVPEGVQIANVIFKVAANKTPSYVLNGTDGRYTIDPVTGNTAKGTVEVTLAGYGKTYTKALTVATEKSIVKAQVNTYLNDADSEVALDPGTQVKTGTEPQVFSYNSRTKKYETISTEFQAVFGADGKTVVVSPIRTEKQQFLKNGEKKLQLQLTTAEDQVQKLEMTVTVKNTAPNIKVNQSRKLNLQDRDSFAVITVEAPGATIQRVTWAGTDFKVLEREDGSYAITYANNAAKPATKSNLNVELDGYYYVPPKAHTLKTENTKIKAVLGSTTLELFRTPMIEAKTTIATNFTDTEVQPGTLHCANAEGAKLTVTYDSTGITAKVNPKKLPKNGSYTFKGTPVAKVETLDGSYKETKLPEIKVTVKFSDTPKVTVAEAKLSLAKAGTQVVKPKLTANKGLEGFVELGEENRYAYESYVDLTYDENGVLKASLKKDKALALGSYYISLMPLYGGMACSRILLKVTVTK